VKKSVIREYAESLIIAVVLALFVRTWVFQAFKIPTGSMEPNLLVGDHLIVNKMIFSPAVTSLERILLPRREIRRGDIIVFKYPEEPERDFIKRVIGLPGDRLELRRKTIYINGSPITEDYAYLTEPPSSAEEVTEDLREFYGPIAVPSDQYFMMGDNRDNSEDSRYWGALPAHYIKGRALFIYFSYDAGAASNPAYRSIRWERLLDVVK